MIHLKVAVGVGSKIVLEEKLDEKSKAQIVAQGSLQIPGLGFNETILLVAKFTALYIFLSLAAMLDLKSIKLM